VKLTDLKLLIDCHIGEITRVPYGFDLANKRLLRLKLIEEDPQWEGFVRLTNAGFKFVEKLLAVEP